MKKTDLIDVMAEAADISRMAAGRALDGMLEAITSAMQDGEPVSIVGFGTFTVRDRAARTGRNPKTGDTIEIPASRTPAFKAGKALKDAVN
jgi:DNA-binding protein HU-beta